MKIKLSKSQWETIGKTAGWTKKAQSDADGYSDAVHMSEMGFNSAESEEWRRRQREKESKTPRIGDNVTISFWADESSITETQVEVKNSDGTTLFIGTSTPDRFGAIMKNLMQAYLKQQ